MDAPLRAFPTSHRQCETTRKQKSMSTRQLRQFELYSDGRETFDTHYRAVKHPFLIEVRATSLRQAIFLAANRRRSPDGLEAGIVSVDHNGGPRCAESFFDGYVSSEAR
jgi:hypothetical protein